MTIKGSNSNLIYFQNTFFYGNQFSSPILHNIVTETINYLKKPINCVIAGQQKEPVKKAMGLDGAIVGPLKGIFGE